MNFFCEYDKKPATAFCFQGAKKLAVCKEHIEDCLSKKLDIYPLDGILFITSPADVPAFRTVSGMSTKGLAYAQVLRATLSQELDFSLNLLNQAKSACFQILNESFAAFEDQLQNRCKAVEKEIEKLEEEMRNLARVKGVSLSKTAEFLTQTEGIVPGLIGFVCWEGRKPLATALFSGFRLDDSDPAEVLLQSLSPDHRSARLQSLYSRCGALMESSDCLDIAEAAYQSSIAAALNTLETTANGQENLQLLMKEAEELWRERKLDEEREVLRLLGKFRSREAVEKLVEESVAIADTFKASNHLESALKWSQTALELSSEFLPDSFALVSSHLQVALIYQRAGMADEAELQLADALELSIQLDPMSIVTAKTYRRLGDLYGDTGRVEEAEQSYKDALSIALENYPNSSDTAATYTNLGILYEGLKRLKEAENCWTKAWQLWQRNHDSRAQTLVFPYLEDLFTRSGRSQELANFSP